MSLHTHEQAAVTLPRQRFGRAFFAALVAVLYVKGFEALMTPNGLGAAIWLKPFSLLQVVSISSLLLAPVALLNTAIFLRPLIKKDGSYWHSVATWILRVVYGALVLYSLYRFTSLSGLLSVTTTVRQLLGLLGLFILTVLNHYAQRARHPFRLLLALTAVTAIVPLFLLLYPIPHLTANSPIIWVAKRYDNSNIQTTPVYWQPDQSVFLQLAGTNYHLEMMSPAFAFRRNEVVTLEGRELVVTSITGTEKRISLKPYIPNYHFILNIQSTRDGVMLNVYAPPNDNYVVRVNLPTGDVSLVPEASRVRCAEATDHYIVNWSKGRTHQVRDGNDRLVRQHGRYPWHFREWDADPVDDLFVIISRSSVTLISPDRFSMSTISPGISISSANMQPGLHQIWIAEAVSVSWNQTPPSCRLRMFAYNGRYLGERIITGGEVIRTSPVEESMARYLVKKYSTK